MSDLTNISEVRLRSRLNRNLRADIMASRRMPDTGQIARCRRALRHHIFNARRRARQSPHLLGVYEFNAPELHIP